MKFIFSAYIYLVICLFTVNGFATDIAVKSCREVSLSSALLWTEIAPKHFDISKLPENLRHPALVYLILLKYPDIVQRDYKLAKQFKKFLLTIEFDSSLSNINFPVNFNTKDTHFEKHRQEFRENGINFTHWGQHINAARKIVENNQNSDYILFRSKVDSRIFYKADLRNETIVILWFSSRRNVGGLITFYPILKKYFFDKEWVLSDFLLHLYLK